MAHEFISVTEAKKLIADHTGLLPAITLDLSEAAGLVLADDVLAATDLPPFNQSSMDGYAVKYHDLLQRKALRLKGESPAGLSSVRELGEGEAMRIFTGAVVPRGADTIIMQERVTINDGALIIDDPSLAKGQHFRSQGTDARAGELALEKGALLNAPAIGFIAGLGVREVRVYRRPTVSVILTGNELQAPGKPLTYGQVYESNSFALTAALNRAGIRDINIITVEDDLEKLSEVLAESLSTSDVVLLTGGVSVGDYDFVLPATQRNGIRQIFHKIRQKPGKPLYFGVKPDKWIFGLPGNPASVLSCFYQYVLPFLGGLSGGNAALKRLNVPLQSSLKKAAGLTHFMKGFYNGDTVRELNAQESFRLSSFAKANCLITLEEDRTTYEAGELVEISLIPD